MLRFTEVVVGGASGDADGVLTLRFDDRRRSRWRTRLDDGREIALVLPRGTILHDGDGLRAQDGVSAITVRAAAQALSLVRADDGVRLARAAYHLGNRHVPVQIGAGWLAYQHDHVLDGMIQELGLRAETVSRSFEPEAGGYRHGVPDAPPPTHMHDHGSGEGEGHSHGHPHGHDHGDHRYGT
jgi:urease accessory protein